MKKHNKVSPKIAYIFIIPIAALMCIYLLFYTPIDYIKYYFSHFRKDMKTQYGKKAKYTWLCSLSNHFRIYEMIAKNNLLIEYFRKPSVKMCTYGYFFYKGALLIVDMVPHYAQATHDWYVVQGHDPADLQIYMENEKEEFEKFMNGNLDFVCERVLFLVNEKDLGDEDKAHMKDVDFVLPYNKKNFAQSIERFFG